MKNGLRQSETGKGYVPAGGYELYPGAGISGPQRELPGHRSGGYRRLPAAAEALRHPGQGRGLLSCGEVLPHHGFCRAVPGVHRPHRPAGHGGKRHSSRHHRHHHRHRCHGLPLHLLQPHRRRQGAEGRGRGRCHSRNRGQDQGASGEPDQAGPDAGGLL